MANIRINNTATIIEATAYVMTTKTKYPRTRPAILSTKTIRKKTQIDVSVEAIIAP